MELSVVGVAHHDTSVEARERMSLNEDAARQFLRAVHAGDVLEEALVLDTCNRTEVFFVAGRLDGCVEYILRQVADVKKLQELPPPPGLYCHAGLDAVRHVFRVASAMDSQILGEHQILGQVKQAYRLAVEERTASFLLNKLLHWAFRAAKRVRTETLLGQGSVSVASAAAALAKQIFSSLAGKTVLLVGAGEMIQLAAKSLIQNGASRVIVANRTVARAQELAAELRDYARRGEALAEAEPVQCPALLRLLGRFQEAEKCKCSQAPPELLAEAVGLDGIAGAITEAELVISSTGSREPVLKYEDLGEVLRRRKKPLCIVDIAVPRDVDERLGKLPNVYLHNLDDLNHIVLENLQQRRKEIPRAQAILDDEVAQFAKWLASLQVTPTIQLLQQHIDALRRAELDRYGKRVCRDGEQLDLFTQSLCKKILHRPLAFLHQLPQQERSSEWMAAVDVIRRMFELDSEELES